MNLSDLDLITAQPKMFLASVVGVGSFLAEIVTQGGWEDLTLKGVLLGTVVYLVREVTRLRVENKEEATAREERANGREERLANALTTNATALRGMETSIREQTEQLHDVMQNVIKRAMGEEPKK